MIFDYFLVKQVRAQTRNVSPKVVVTHVPSNGNPVFDVPKEVRGRPRNDRRRRDKEEKRGTKMTFAWGVNV